MTNYHRRCTNGKRCPNSPACGLDCHFDTAEDHDEWVPLDDTEIESIWWAFASAATAAVAVVATILMVLKMSGVLK